MKKREAIGLDFAIDDNSKVAFQLVRLEYAEDGTSSIIEKKDVGNARHMLEFEARKWLAETFLKLEKELNKT